MAKVASNESEMIRTYLKKLNNNYFTKAEEQVIGRRIKKVEAVILELCLKSDVFIDELERVCDAVLRNKNNAVKYSKKLIDDSPDEDKLRISEYFAQIKEIIVKEGPNTKEDTVLISKLVSYVGLTSSALSQMILPIKQKHDSVQKYLDETAKLYNFIEIETDEEYDEFVLSSQNQTFRKSIARKLFTTDELLTKKLRSQEENLKYLIEVGLTPEKIKSLHKLIKALTPLEAEYRADRELLIKANLPLVVSRAKRFNHGEMDLEDLIQEGNIGLIKAVDKYDPDKNVKITTYATWWIDQAIRRSISNQSRTVRVPTHIQQDIKTINQAFFCLSQKLGKEPSLREIAEHTGIPLDKIEGINKTALHEVGIDSEISQGLSYNDILFDKQQNTLYQSTSRTILKDKIRLAISELSPRSQKVIMLRFGIGVARNHTLEEIGVKFSVSKQRIRQIETRALTDLKGTRILPEN